MAAYLTLAEFKGLTIMPSADVDEVETAQAGWIASQLDLWSRYIDARLRKRYEAPFSAPYPLTVTMWLTHLVTTEVYLKRGVDPNDAQWEIVTQRAEQAKAELEEAADSEKGKFDLPLRSDTTNTGITQGTPAVYSEASPYVAFDGQRDTATDEDMNGSGTYG